MNNYSFNTPNSIVMKNFVAFVLNPGSIELYRPEKSLHLKSVNYENIKIV